MANEVTFSEAGRAALKRGVDKVADAVKATLGPKGRNVVIDRSFGSPIVTKDGVTVARNIELKNLEENLGATLLKEVASKTNDVAGDGTTTATVLAQAMFSQGLKSVTAGASPLGIRRGMERATAALVQEIKEHVSQPVSGDMIEHVASISANDPAVGKIVAAVVQQVGEDGIVTVENGSIGITTEVVKGLKFDRGYCSPYMVTNVETMIGELEQVKVLLMNGRISNIREVLPVIEALIKEDVRQLVVIANEFDESVISNFVVNKAKGAFTIMAIKSPGFAERRKELLTDMAHVVNGTVFGDEAGIGLKDATPMHLGYAGKIVVTQESTTIIGGGAPIEMVKQRAEQLKALAEQSSNEHERTQFLNRASKLASGVAVIRVGAATEAESIELKHRVIDAVCATKAALEEGIVPGGGVALIRAQVALDAREQPAYDEDELIGAQIVRRAIEEPLRCIVGNAGKDVSMVVSKIKEMTGTGGYNAATDTYEDLLVSGVIDPTKVTRCALENATSIAALLLTTEVVITTEPEKVN